MKSVRILYLVVLALCFSYMVMIADYISFLTLCAALLLPVLLAVQALLLRGKITAVCPEHADFIAEEMCIRDRCKGCPHRHRHSGAHRHAHGGGQLRRRQVCTLL